MQSGNDFGGFHSIEEYLADLWWNMHHIDDPNRQAWAFHSRCYLDESGTHDTSHYTVVAGLLLNRNNFISLGTEWQKLLREMRIKPPIHMKEFGRPHGDLAYLTDNERYFLFANIAGIINSHKIYSIAGIIGQKQYKISEVNKRKEMSPYGFCFLICVKANQAQAVFNKYPYNIAYLMSEVSEHKGQILDAHAEIKRQQEKEGKSYNVGSITFEYPKYVPALQAADVIAWGVNHRLMNKPFNQGFEFIENIISGPGHVQEPYKDDYLHGLKQRLMKYRDQNH